MSFSVEMPTGSVPVARREAVDAFREAQYRESIAESRMREAQYDQSKALAELLAVVEPWELINALSNAQAKSIVRRLAAE